MMKWLGEILGGGGKLPEGVSREWAARLDAAAKEVVACRPGCGPETADEVVRFVLTGEPAAVVQRFQGLGHYSFQYWRSRTHGHVRATLDGLGALPTAVVLRWARVVEWAFGLTHEPALPDGSRWHVALVTVACMPCPDGGSTRLHASQLDALAVEAGWPASAWIAALLGPRAPNYTNLPPNVAALAVDGFAQAFERHLDDLRPLLLPKAVHDRQRILAFLEHAGPQARGCAATEIAELATCSSKTVRAEAEKLVSLGEERITEVLRAVARQGKPEERAHALRHLAKHAAARKDDALGAFVRDTAGADSSKLVQDVSAEWSRETLAASAAPPAYDFEIPSLDWSAAANRVPDPVLEELVRSINGEIAVREGLFRMQQQQRIAAGRAPWDHVPLRPFSAQDLEALRAALASDAPELRKGSGNERRFGITHAPLLEVARTAGLTPIALMRLLTWFQVGEPGLDRLTAWAMGKLHARTGRPSLLELDEMLRQAGHDRADIIGAYCSRWSSLGADWPASDVWPYFAHRADLVAERLKASVDHAEERARLYEAIALLPHPPPQAVPELWRVALGTSRAFRTAAQDALARLPGKEATIVAALADRKAEVRAVAAAWLGRLRHEPAIPALETAVRKEKDDVAKGAMLDALAALGRPVDAYLDLDGLAVQAKAGLARMPKELDWFPWSALPAVRWAARDEHVPADLVKWLLVQAVKQKSPEPNAVLRKICDLFDPRDRERAGQVVLEAWLHEDVRPIPAEEALSRAQAQARMMHSHVTSHPQYYADSPFLGRSVEEITSLLLPGLARQPQGSAIGSKGLLAFVAACGRERVAAPVQRYLKEWYGTRAAQGRALIGMLGWVDHPSSTQLMLSIGSRFRTKSFQAEATKQAEALAERKGWTLDELADRTIPTAGFDEDGVLELSYGPRSFTARLLPDMTIELLNPEGKKIASLPAPRGGDDEAAAKDAKRALSLAKKELKSIVSMQSARLYEALCTEREWPWEDWDAHVNRHPILRHLAQRLAWAHVEDGAVRRVFRPLPDGTLTDRHDEEVRLPAGARVRLAHDSLLPADEIAAWLEHFADYEIAPPFQQLGKGCYALPEDRAHATELTDFEGHVLPAFSLRGRATKLGWTRGQAMDGGWFYEYEKRFPTLGLQAVLVFTGNTLPEENRKVALKSLSFAKASSSTDGERATLPLGGIPKILLSECHADVRLLAAEGTGFDPSWTSLDA